MSIIIQEPILTPVENRFVIFPIQHQDLWDYYKLSESAMWRVEEVDLTEDISHWESKLNENEKYFIKNILSFFAACLPAEQEIYDINLKKHKIKDVIDKVNRGEDFFTLSCSQEGNIVASKVINGKQTGEVSRLLEITLDNDESFKCTPTHQLMGRNGEFKFAEDFKEGDSLMPMYASKEDRRFGLNVVKNNNTQKFGVVQHELAVYRILNKDNNKSYIGSTKVGLMDRFYQRYGHDFHYTYEHEANNYIHEAMRKYGVENFSVETLWTGSDESVMFEKEKFYIQHFDSFKNGYNGSISGKGGIPDSKWINKDDVSKIVREEEVSEYLDNGWVLGMDEKTLQTVSSTATENITRYNKSDDKRRKTSEDMVNRWNNDEMRQTMCERSSDTMNKTLNKLWQNEEYRKNVLYNRPKARILNAIKNRMAKKGMSLEKAVSKSLTFYDYYSSIDEVKAILAGNHKIKSVKVIEYDNLIPVYDIEVDSIHSTFPVAGGVFIHNSDGIVNENIAENFLREVQYPEAKFFYGFQIMMENIHSLMYSQLIDTLIKNPKEKDECFNALSLMPAVQKKGEWALNWISSESFVERLIAFVAVEGIFFSGSFCSIFWLKTKGLMPGLCLANEFISKDEATHADYAIHLLNNHIVNKPSEDKIKEILLSAFEIEKEFIAESLPVSLIGMNKNLMIQYIEYVVDQLLLQLGCKIEFGSKNPFDFMMQIALDRKNNFFEKRGSNYKKANTGGELSFDEEF